MWQSGYVCARAISEDAEATTGCPGVLKRAAAPHSAVLLVTHASRGTGLGILAGLFRDLYESTVVVHT